MLCSMCQHGINVKATHKCVGCGVTLCSHFGKSCPTCKPSSADADRQAESDHGDACDRLAGPPEDDPGSDCTVCGERMLGLEPGVCGDCQEDRQIEIDHDDAYLRYGDGLFFATM